MASPFDYASSASESIDNEILTGKLDPDVPVFVFLRAVGSHADTVLLADEVQAHFRSAPSRFAYHSMHALIEPKRKRFAKWIKPVEEFPKDLLEAVMVVYEVSKLDAQFILEEIMKDEERVSEFKRMLDMEERKRGRKK